MGRLKGGASSAKEMAYARRIFNAQGYSKESIALDVGYSEHTARNVGNKIENRPGFHNAMAKIAMESNCLTLAIMEEFQARGVKDFSNRELISAISAVSGAWAKFQDRFEGKLNKESGKGGNNKLRNIIIQRVENQTVTNGKIKKEEGITEELSPVILDTDSTTIETDDEF